MPPETEVVSCPACKHLLRVPADWLGQTVQCPECKATFTAPTRAGDALTDPVLISAPAPVRVAPARPKRDLMLMLPAFGLMLVGVVSLIINGYMGGRFLLDPAFASATARQQILMTRQMGFGAEDPEEDRARLDEERAAEAVKWLRVGLPAFAVVGAVIFVGGVAMVRRKGYRLAQVACVLAALNLPNLCCLPGAIFGLWGMLMLMSDEGREHFA
jgi:hypothetical protein